MQGPPILAYSSSISSYRATVANYVLIQYPTVSPNHSDSQAYKAISHLIKKGEELHLNVQGELLDKREAT